MDYNLKEVAERIKDLREAKGYTKEELAKLTGLTAATVTNLTAELIGGDLVSECSTGVSTGGRRPVMLKVNSNGFFVASAYISPERTEFVVSDFGAEIICYKKHMLMVSICFSFWYETAFSLRVAK